MGVPILRPDHLGMKAGSARDRLEKVETTPPFSLTRLAALQGAAGTITGGAFNAWLPVPGCSVDFTPARPMRVWVVGQGWAIGSSAANKAQWQLSILEPSGVLGGTSASQSVNSTQVLATSGIHRFPLLAVNTVTLDASLHTFSWQAFRYTDDATPTVAVTAWIEIYGLP